MKIVYTLTPKSRISPGRRAQVQNVREIHEVIPGSVVRGALGTAWWGSPDSRFEPENQAVFDELFARGMDVMAAIPAADPTPGSGKRLSLRSRGFAASTCPLQNARLNGMTKLWPC